MALTRSDFPDWIRGMLLIGQDDEGNQVPVFVGDDGRIYTWLIGQDAGGDPQTVKVDSDGQLYTVLRGAGDVDVAVDASGFLTALFKGIDGGATLRTVAVDASGQIIMVPRGSTGNYLAVDASGYLTAVLKGLKDATLTTISVDAQGRIEAFGLDAESQWGDTLKTGNSELAARLGSPMAWDWRGNVLCLCTFADGIPFKGGTGYGTGSSVTTSPDYSVYGGYAAKMVAGSDGNHGAALGGILGPNPSQRVGIEIRFSIDEEPTDLYIDVTVQAGTNAYRGRAQLDLANDDLEYMNSGGTWTKIDDLELYQTPSAFHSFKLVVDGDSGKYVRVMVNETEFDISAYDLLDLGAAFTPLISFSIFLTGREGANDIAYIDSFVFTINEPL